MSVNGVNSNYFKDAIKYITGNPVVSGATNIIQDSADAVKQAPSFTIFEMAPKIYNGARYGMNSTGVTGLKGAIKSLSDLGGLVDDTVTLQQGLKGASMNYDALSTIYKAQGALGSAASNETAQAAINLAKEGLKNGSAETITQASIKTEEALKLAKSAAKEAKPGLFAKFKGIFKGTKGAADTLNAATTTVQGTAEAAASTAGAAASGAAKNGIFAKMGKAMKASGAGIIAVFEGVGELFTNVIPAFSAGGVESGVKQVAKSGVKVAASTAGFAGGSLAGKAAGSWIGGAIGTIFGPVGTGIGTTIGGMLGGFVGGLIGSSLASKGAQKITGKSEVEKLQDKALEEQSAQVAQSPQAINELNQLVSAQIQADLADDGKLTKDSEKMLEYLNTQVQTPADIPFTSSENKIDAKNQAQTDEGTVQTDVQTSKDDSVRASELNELVDRVNSGDTSVFDVPESAFNTINEQSSKLAGLNGVDVSYANNYTNAGLSNPYSQNNTSESIFAGNQKLNYYGV